jgi:8-hydroxy-5-deazaflavin:NADPH oxidoreductase
MSMKIGIVGAGKRALAETLAEKGKAHGEPGRLALPVAGDSAEGKQLVMRLVEDTGFDAVDAGTIAESWHQQMGNPAYCTELTAGQLREALGLAGREAAPKRRDAIVQIVSTWQGPSSYRDWLRLYRAVVRFPAADD